MKNSVGVYNNRTKQEIEYIQSVKQELMKYQDKKREILDKKNRIMHLESRINSTSTQAKEVCVQSQSDPKGIEEMLASAADLRVEYGSMLIEAEGICEHIERLINLADGIASQMLYQRFVVGQSVEAIAHSHVYSRRHVYNIMDDGMICIGKKIARHCTSRHGNLSV
jgi:hypothetical protein